MFMCNTAETLMNVARACLKGKENAVKKKKKKKN